MQESDIHDSIPRLICQGCNASTEVTKELYDCPECGGTLDIEYDLISLGKTMKSRLSSRSSRTMWKYRELLPILRKASICSMGEGGTPLVKSINLQQHVGIKTLHIKNDGLNPTGSFKARQVSTGISKAIELGKQDIGVVSSGNVGYASAAYAAHAGLKCTIVIWGQMEGLADPRVKMFPALFFGATLVQTSPSRSPYFIRDSLLLMRDNCIQHDWMPLISARCVNPFAEEGAKTMAYEICEDLDWAVPDWVCVPIGGGGLLSMLWKGFKELHEMDLIDTLPRIAGFQSGSFQQVAYAFKNGMNVVEPAYEILKDSAFAYSLDGDWALQAIRESKGFADILPTTKVIETQGMLAKHEGIVAEPMAAWATAGMMTAIEEGKIKPDETVVTCVTGKNIDYSPFIPDDYRIKEVDLDDIARLFGES